MTIYQIILGAVTIVALFLWFVAVKVSDSRAKKFLITLFIILAILCFLEKGCDNGGMPDFQSLFVFF